MSQVSMQSYVNGLVGYQNSGVKQMSQIKRFNDAQSQVQEILAGFDEKRERITSLGEGSASFLRDYSAGMGRLATEASQLTGQNASEMLKDDKGQVTQDTVSDVVSSARSMVEEYNSSLALARDNAGRGEGVAAQRERMRSAPAQQSAMNLAGITQNGDGSLTLDEGALTSALSSADESTRGAAVGALGQVAEGIQEDARVGINTASGSLIENDIRRMRSSEGFEEEQEQSSALEEMYFSFKGAGAFWLNNMAATGMLLNMVA